MFSVIVCSESETPDHLEESQMCAVTNEIDVIGTDAILDISKGRAVGVLESGFEWLHPRAYEESGGIVVGDDVSGKS